MRDYSLEFLTEKSDQMHDYLRLPALTMDQEAAVVDRLMHLGRMLSLSGEYKAFAVAQYDQIVHGEIGQAIDRCLSEKLSVSLINQYVKTAAYEWNYLINSFDRINSAAGKMIMAIQTLISYEKEKMKMI